MKLAVIAVVAGLCAFIWRANGYELYVLALLGLTTIVGVGLNVLLGMSGQISLGHAAFYAIGAYVVAIFTTKLDWTVWAALPIAGLIAGVAGVLLAIPALRVRGPYLAMVTIAFGFVLEQGKDVGMDVAQHRQVRSARLQILADSKHVDSVRAHVAHHGEDLVVGFPQADHQPGLGRDVWKPRLELTQ